MTVVDHFLACITLQDCRPGQHAYGATGADKYVRPCARNTLILARYEEGLPSASAGNFKGDILRYGQRLRLLAHPSVQDLPVDSAGGPRPLYLFSKPISTVHYSKHTREQICGFTGDPSFDTVFQVCLGLHKQT